ncbi:MAG: hypothetical protein EOO09_12470 [Chitinophagaceae bacterium]|nr:MAG: hypothetical protein EOO09_12470 [Chitinophagaceae bacterium]
MATFTKTLAAFLLTIISTPGFSQSTPGSPAILSNALADSLVIHYLDKVDQVYFDKAGAATIRKELTHKRKAGEFYNLPAKTLTDTLSRVLRRITHDIHFYVGVKDVQKAETDRPKDRPKINNNGGFAEVRLLRENIGYLKWTNFIADDNSFQKFIAAAKFLQGCESLIIDISQNGGGDGRIGGFVNQHLYEDAAYQDLLIKKCGGEKDWHQSEVPYNYSDGPKFYDIPVFIMVSDRTASAAEYFAFIAQEMKRATILGAKTAGAGNPVTMVNFDNYFAYIPICQITTKSGKSIEGVGVTPDVPLTENRLEATIEYILAGRDKR